MRQLACEAEIERKALAAELLTDLNREPSAIDKVAIEVLSAAVIRARRLRSHGKNDADERKTIIQAIRATGLRPSPAAAKPDEPWGLLFPEADATEG